MSSQSAATLKEVGKSVRADSVEPLELGWIRLFTPGLQWMMAAIALMVFAGEAWAAHLVALGGVASNVAKSLPGLGLLIAVSIYCRWRGFNRFFEFTRLLVWSVIGIRLVGPLVLLAGRTHSVLVDPALLRLDSGLHFSTAVIVRAIAHLPILQLILAVSYNLWIPLAAAALLVPVICGRPTDSRRYVLSLAIGSLITTALFALWPAVGPWRMEGFAASQQQAAVESYLSLLKSPGSVEINPDAGGIIAFPSFHVVLALLSAIALWGIRWLRWIALGVAAMICVSTITTGWHYLTDVLGGFAVTAVAIALARWMIKSPEAPSLDT